jgi:hypothetical protein
MFEDLHDAVSLVFCHWWPKAEGEITAVEVERIHHSQGRDTLRLAVAYKFSLGDDGPYTGESFWQPSFFVNKRVAAARHRLHCRQRVLVRYRSSDPSVNKLDHSVWRNE